MAIVACSRPPVEMESRCKAGVIVASTRSGGGVRLQSHGVQLLGCRGFLMVVLVFVTATTFVFEEVHCTDAFAPAPTPTTQQMQINWTFNQYEADALNAVFQKWSKQNPQLSTLLNWTRERHPCNNLTELSDYGPDFEFPGFEFPGAWTGVGCTPVLQELTDISTSYHIYVSSLTILKGNSSSQLPGSSPNMYNFDGFEGIIGQLPFEISNLTNLNTIDIGNNPKLTGPVPVEIFHMPNLINLYLYNNSLNGTLPFDDVYDADCSLYQLDLSNNNFSGSLRVSSQGTLFCQNLNLLNLESNQLDGPINLQKWNSSFEAPSLYLGNNQFKGTFSSGPYSDASHLDFSNNDITSIQLANYTGVIGRNEFASLSTIYMPSLQHLNISSNNLKGLFPREILAMPSLQILDLSMNNFSGSIDFESLNTSIVLDSLYINNNNFNGTFFTNAYVNPTIMDLSNNQFNDITFHEYFESILPNGSSYISNLKKIYFQNNNLKGQFPAHLLNTSTLQILNASQNQYQILQLPNIGFENSSFLQIFITNNDLSSVKYSNIGPFTTYNIQYSNFLFLGGNPICKKIENSILSNTCRLSPLDQAPPEFEKKEVKLNLYSYKEIKLATNNFDKDNKLGEGSFGVVFKGELSDGTQAAVKKLTMSSNQVLSEFLNEVIVISGLKHRNLVKLKGCCLGDGDQRILVLEYVENKNLAEALWIDDDLQHNSEPPCLDWETRFNIIVGIARGLAYLHEELQPPIIHRDIKASNILLDKNYNPKIADFGLAYLFPALDSEASHLTLMEVGGTRGYCSPEYALQGHVSTALDVYSFGILMLEIVSGRKNINLQKPSEEIYLREWAWKQYEAMTTMTLIDSKMEHSPSDLDVIMRVIVVALACVHYKAARRPKMHNVLSMLSENIPLSEFQKGFEDGEVVTEVRVELPLTLDTTSSLWSNENLHVDDCCLLSEIGGIEMNSIVK